MYMDDLIVGYWYSRQQQVFLKQVLDLLHKKCIWDGCKMVQGVPPFKVFGAELTLSQVSPSILNWTSLIVWPWLSFSILGEINWILPWILIPNDTLAPLFDLLQGVKTCQYITLTPVHQAVTSQTQDAVDTVSWNNIPLTCPFDLCRPNQGCQVSPWNGSICPWRKPQGYIPGQIKPHRWRPRCWFTHWPWRWWLPACRMLASHRE